MGYKSAVVYYGSEGVTDLVDSIASAQQLIKRYSMKSSIGGMYRLGIYEKQKASIHT